MGLALYIGARHARLPGFLHTVAPGLVVDYLGDLLLGHAALASLISWVGVAGLRYVYRRDSTVVFSTLQPQDGLRHRCTDYMTGPSLVASGVGGGLGVTQDYTHCSTSCTWTEPRLPRCLGPGCIAWPFYFLHTH